MLDGTLTKLASCIRESVLDLKFSTQNNNNLFASVFNTVVEEKNRPVNIFKTNEA